MSEVSVNEVNDFQWWENALAGKHAPIDVNTPHAGYYREGRAGRPVSFWWDTKTGELRCHLDGKDFDAQRALEKWPFASKNPVSREDYIARLRDGKWPGENEAVIGHNKAPVDDSVEALTVRIDDLAREAEKMIADTRAQGGEISDAWCDQASDLANTFGEIEGKITGLHKTEKEPHLEAGRTVDRKWFALRDKAADLKRRLKIVVVTPWLKKKSDDAQKANVAAISAGAAPETLAQPRLTAGSSKRSSGLRTQTSAEVTDWDAIIAALKEHPDVREAVQRIANASAKAGVTLPGMKIIKNQVAA